MVITMPKAKDVGLILSDDGYSIRVGEETSEVIGFGEGPLTFECNGEQYIAHVDLPEGKEAASEVESCIDADGWVFRLVDTGAEPEEDEGGDDDGGEEVVVEAGEEEAA